MLIDAIGQACPKPVIMAEEALKKQAKKLGYKKVYRHPGGIKAWLEADYKVDKVQQLFVSIREERAFNQLLTLIA